MTRIESPAPLQELHALLAQLIQQFGLKRIVIALVKEAIKPTPRKADAAHLLSDHLRQDVGLPPKFPTPERWWKAPF